MTAKEQMNETDNSMSNIPFRNAQIVQKIMSEHNLQSAESEASKIPATGSREHSINGHELN